MGLISRFVSKVFGKKSKKSKGGETNVVNVSELKDSPEQGMKIANQEAARNAPILFVEEEIKDSKQLLQLAKSDREAPIEDSANAIDTSQSSASSPAISSKKPPMCPKKAKSPDKGKDESQELESSPAAAESNLDSSLLDVPRTPRGGFLSGNLTPRGLSGNLTPRGMGSLTPRALAGALTPRGGSGHSFQRLD
jgi:hypothetical protein